MYMCRETIRRAIVQKFNESKKWNCQDINELYDKIEDKKEANSIINSLKICDPAVGSGHFLVSALNEIIAIKNDLKILSDRGGKRLKEYSVEVVSDELIVTDEEGQIFEYNPQNKESQRIQETLFHEKQTIIENCLFGIDINPNSVKICRLRLWIELLKNAYYKAPTFTELETLPNIDINIKCGNSLISRYALDADIHQALKRSKWSIDSYRLAVMTYRNAENKNQKQAMEKLIDEIKSDFESEVASNDRRVIRLKKGKDELLTHSQQTNLFEFTKAEKATWETKLKKLTAEITKLEAALEEIKNNKIYEYAFEWRFEFPEVLNDEGDFIGFDVVIGNPSYIAGKDLDTDFKEYIKLNYPNTIGKFDVYITFIEQGLNILRNRKNLCFIIPNTLLTNENAQLLRASLLKNKLINKITVLDDKVFEEAFVESIIIELDNQTNHEIIELINKGFKLIRKVAYSELNESKDKRIQVHFNIKDRFINDKVARISIKLGDIVDFCIGIQIGGEGNSKDFKNEFISTTKLDDSYQKVLDGKDFDTYKINWVNKFIKYGDWLHRKRDDKYFLNPKIIIRQIGATPFATIDFDKYYTLNTIYNGILLNKDFNISYVFALINSKLNKYIWTKMFFDGKALFPKIKKSQLNEITIANISLAEQKPFIELVNSILTAKKQDPAADTSMLEKEIDQLVYKLYGLTEEEIKIVEQN